MKEVLVSVRVEEALRAELKRLAEVNERSFSGEIRRALRLYVSSQQDILRGRVTE